MDNDKVIEVRSDEERRTFQRRREDRGERRFALLQASATILEFSEGINIKTAVDYAEQLLKEIDSREAERAKGSQ